MARGSLSIVVLLLLGLPLAGCLGGMPAGQPAPDGGPAAEPHPLQLQAHAVIAVIDTGINPYHHVFRDPARTLHPSSYIPGYPADAKAINVTFEGESYEEVFEKDRSQWENVSLGQLVWIPGTPLIGGIAVAGVAQRYPVLDEQSHGSGIFYVIRQVCPNCSLVTIDRTGSTVVEALDWVAAQPWIDAVSMSWLAGGYTDRATGMDEARQVRDALSRVFDSGKLLLAAAGNTPHPYVHYLPQAHPSVITVGGVEYSEQGATIIASKLPDMVSNYTGVVAHVNTFDSVGWGPGTSFAVPAVAATFGATLIALREAAGDTAGIKNGSLVVGAEGGPGLLADGKVTNKELWSSLNASALYFDAVDYDPTKYHYYNEKAVWLVTMTTPVTPEGFTTMGWGYHGVASVQNAIDHALGKASTLDSRKAAAAPFMAQKNEAERAVWYS